MPREKPPINFNPSALEEVVPTELPNWLQKPSVEAMFGMHNDTILSLDLRWASRASANLLPSGKSAVAVVSEHDDPVSGTGEHFVFSRSQAVLDTLNVLSPYFKRQRERQRLIDLGRLAANPGSSIGPLGILRKAFTVQEKRNDKLRDEAYEELHKIRNEFYDEGERIYFDGMPTYCTLSIPPEGVHQLGVSNIFQQYLEYLGTDAISDENQTDSRLTYKTLNVIPKLLPLIPTDAANSDGMELLNILEMSCYEAHRQEQLHSEKNQNWSIFRYMEVRSSAELVSSRCLDELLVKGYEWYSQAYLPQIPVSTSYEEPISHFRVKTHGSHPEDL